MSPGRGSEQAKVLSHHAVENGPKKIQFQVKAEILTGPKVGRIVDFNFTLDEDWCVRNDLDPKLLRRVAADLGKVFETGKPMNVPTDFAAHFDLGRMWPHMNGYSMGSKVITEDHGKD